MGPRSLPPLEVEVRADGAVVVPAEYVGHVATCVWAMATRPDTPESAALRTIAWAMADAAKNVPGVGNPIHQVVGGNPAPDA